MTTIPECSECGARYVDEQDSCAAHFEQLLALDHSRREPWGSRHGQAFAAFALQHPDRHQGSLEVAWQALYSIYVLHEAPTEVFTSVGRSASGVTVSGQIPPRPGRPASRPNVTIADLGDFSATSYATQ